MLRSLLAVCALSAIALGVAAAFRQDMPQPTKEHAMVLEGVGTWEGTMTNFGPTPSGKPETASCREVIEPIGGFWTQSKFTCEFMGMPYVGTGCLGYDPESGKYIGTWIDNMSSFMALMKGDYDAAKKALIMRWEGPDMTGAMKPQRFEAVHTGDAYTTTFYMEDTKVMVVEMQRKPTASARPAGAK